MKYTKFLIIPLIAASISSCNNGVDLAAQEADINAKVEAKVAATASQLKADCDARVTLAAQMKADSITAAKSAKKAPPVVAVPVAPKVAPAPAPVAKPAPAPVKKPVAVKKPTPAPKPAPTVGNGKPKMGGSGTVKVVTNDGKTKVVEAVGNGKPKMGGSGTVKVVTEEGKTKVVEAVGNGKPKMGGK